MVLFLWCKATIADFPMIHAGNRFVDSLFSQLPYKPFEYFEMIKRDKAPPSIEPGKSVYIKISAEYHEAKKTYNVVGYIEGSDLKLKNEYVILGAHLDHVGYQGDKLYFGATLMFGCCRVNCHSRGNKKIANKTTTLNCVCSILVRRIGIKRFKIFCEQHAISCGANGCHAQL